MAEQTSLVAVGVGLTTFLIVGLVVTELFAGVVEFSLFVGIPLGAIAGAFAAFAVPSLLDAPTGSPWRVPLAGVAAFGYTVLVLGVVRYAISATRSMLSIEVVAGLGLLGAIVVAGWLTLADSSGSRL